MIELLSRSNTKLGKIAGFAISTKSCSKYNGMKYQGCKAYCYAKKFEKLRARVREKWELNLKATKQRDFVMRMIDEVQWVGDFIRVHVAGDFYSQEYLNKWITIARQFPHKTFLAYTKNIDLDFSKRPENFRIILSDDRLIWQNRFGQFDGAATMTTHKDCFECPYVKRHATCHECLHCFHDNPFVYFIKH
jgi:hypothetical protein